MTKEEKRTLNVWKEMFNIIRSEWGRGWNHLGDELKRAIIAQRVMFRYTGMSGVRESVPPDEIHECYMAMLNFCGLENE